MSWHYDDLGTFPDRKAAIDWAHRNNVDIRDLHFRDRGNGVEVGLRDNARRDHNEWDNRHGGRKDGFWQ